MKTRKVYKEGSSREYDYYIKVNNEKHYVKLSNSLKGIKVYEAEGQKFVAIGVTVYKLDTSNLTY